MNKIILIGRLTKEPEIKELNNNKYLKNSIAVQRDIKNKNGEYETDFFNFTVWNKVAEYLHNYSKKGDLVSLIGKLQNRNYEKDGQKIFNDEIVVNEIKVLTYHSKEKASEEIVKENNEEIEFLD